jgi:hypothetical protein
MVQDYTGFWHEVYNPVFFNSGQLRLDFHAGAPLPGAGIGAECARLRSKSTHFRSIRNRVFVDAEEVTPVFNCISGD